MLIYALPRCLHKYSNTKYFAKAFYSGRNYKHEKFYKMVGKVENYPKKYKTAALVPIPNWELLKPRGYRFFMPGSTGPAWHDAYTTGYNLPQDFDLESTELECYAQECPVLLRSVVNELFRGIDLSYSRLTIISLSHKQFGRNFNQEKKYAVTKKFVLTAQDISRKLKSAGYWADFINPFSGLPCINVYPNSNLYEVDPRFRCLGFQVIEHENCRVIEDKRSKRFIGSLFTTAPPNANVLRRIVLNYE